MFPVSGGFEVSLFCEKFTFCLCTLGLRVTKHDKTSRTQIEEHMFSIATLANEHDGVELSPVRD